MHQPSWVADSCTLPTLEQPLRQAEWEALVAGHLAGVRHPEPGQLILTLRGGNTLREHLNDLVERESECCSFFTFTITATPQGADLGIGVDREHEPFLDALAASCRPIP